MDLPNLYHHQSDMVGRLRTSLAKCGASILNARTGAGKTRMAKWIMAKSLNNPDVGNILFTVHRRGLVDNACERLDEEPAVPYGVLMSGREAAYGQKLQVASIDSLLSWFVNGDEYSTEKTYDLIVMDEAHSHHSKLQKFLKAHDAYRKSRGLRPSIVIGLTATPRAKGLADVYQDIVNGPSGEWLIQNGYSSPFRYFRATQGQLDLLKKSSTGDFTKDSVSAAMDGLAGDLVRDWRQHADGRPTIGFFPRLSHAKEALELLQADGIQAEHVDGDTDDDRRRTLYKRLSNGVIDYLCNVGVVERGTDIPAVSCIQLCTAVGSVVRYVQMIGRGSRTCDGKSNCIVLDHGGNVKRHGFWEDEIAWTLDTTNASLSDHKTRPTVECPGCSAIYRGGRCRNCGYEPTKRERKAQGLVFDGSELREVQRTTGTRSAAGQSPERIMVGALFAAGKCGQTWRQAVAIAKRRAAAAGVPFHVPNKVTVAGVDYKMLPYGHPKSSQRVKYLFDGRFK